ncbi:PEP-CTERM sorting domain-containing protein [Roseateles sp. DAIF2]|uniref:PEP-CTERM sorting domain-containing protein n=1 Tax=Roseateles sp. DAIF2 TaxID=2714952 RepID=UPI0018A24913|nr:PEP-CTERM sorting domain-containing protein [Roseateles sp. DAIF2]QPF75578.1 PEP-CTERM sorting domain-containing protein [Roseateles sp. DAIF2]
MTKTITKQVLISAAALLALGAGQAQAAQFNGAIGQGVSVTDYSEAGKLAFDLDFAQRSQVTLNFSLDAQDLALGSLSFNALVRNLSGLGFEGTQVALSGIGFALPRGTLTTDGFQSVVAQGGNAQSAWARFGAPGVTTEFYIGNPLGNGSATDWTLDLAGHQVGDTFRITVAVPEPESYALMIAGLAAVGFVARRRKQQQA